MNVATEIADPTLPLVVACRIASDSGSCGELHVDYAVSVRLIGYLCRYVRARRGDMIRMILLDSDLPFTMMLESGISLLNMLAEERTNVVVQMFLFKCHC